MLLVISVELVLCFVFTVLVAELFNIKQNYLGEGIL